MKATIDRGLFLYICVIMKMILELVWAIVGLSTGFLRNAPDYEAGLDTQLLMGSVVQIDSAERYWRHVTAMEPAYRGWINELQLVTLSDKELSEYLVAPKYICIAGITDVFDKPSQSSPRICDLVMGDILRRTGRKSGKWVQVILPSGQDGWVRGSEVAEFERWARTRQPSAENILALAHKFLGSTYMWGGTSFKHVDCSGLTRSVYFMNGILLPRDANQQVRVGYEVGLDMDEWQPGDLVFFGTPQTEDAPLKAGHVAIYIGGGRIIHSSQLVRVSSLIEGTPDYYERKPIAVRRILGHVGEDNGTSDIRTNCWYFIQ